MMLNADTQSKTVWSFTHTHISMCEIKTDNNLQKWQCSKLEHQFHLHHASWIKVVDDGKRKNGLEKDGFPNQFYMCQQQWE